MNLARLGNKYLTETEPWKIFKTEPERVKTILNIALQISANLAVLGEPFLPFTSKKLFAMLAIEPLTWEHGGDEKLLVEGSQLNKPDFLFSKIEDKEIEFQVQKLQNTKEQNMQEEVQAAPAKENIEFDDFAKLDIRVGTILEAEKVAKTKKLVKLLVDTGLDKRTVVAGIGEFYKAEDIIGKKVSILINLAPKNLRGIDSNGMVLMAENQKGELLFVNPEEDKDVENGSAIK